MSEEKNKTEESVKGMETKIQKDQKKAKTLHKKASKGKKIKKLLQE